MNFDFAKEERKSAQNLMNSCFFQAQRIHPRERKCPIRKKKKKKQKKKKKIKPNKKTPSAAHGTMSRGGIQSWRARAGFPVERSTPTGTRTIEDENRVK